jgi:hypothetical protein
LAGSAVQMVSQSRSSFKANLEKIVGSVFFFLQNLSILNRIEGILPGAFNSNHVPSGNRTALAGKTKNKY